MIYFKEVEIEGYGSIQIPFTFTLDKPGLTVIKAPNGEGKTTILSALSWCCTGYPLKEGSTVETWEHLRTKLWRGTRVKVTFEKKDHTYKIIRCKNYTGKVNGAKGKNRLIILEDDVEVDGLKKKAQAEIRLRELLGFSYELFKSALAMGQKVKGLVEEDNSTRAKIFEEAFSITYLDKAKEFGKAHLKTEREKLDQINSKLLPLKTSLTTKREVLSDRIEQAERFEEQKQLRISNLKRKIRELKTRDSLKASNFKKAPELKRNLKKAKEELEKAENYFEDLQEYQAAYNKSSYQLETGKTKRELIEENLGKLHDQISDAPTKCPLCGKPFTEEAQNKYIFDLQTEAEDLNTKLKTINFEIEGYQRKADNLKPLVSSISDKKHHLNTLRSKVKKLENQKAEIKSYKLLKKNIKSQLKELTRELNQEEQSEFTGDTTKIKAQIKALRKEIRPLKKLAKSKTQITEALKWCIEDPLSNKGIKAFVFDQLMGEFNQKLEAYTKILGFQVVFGMNMESARKSIETSIITNGNEIPQKDLSGGQSQLANIAAAFALHDIVNKVLNTNVLFIDEAFESLDSTNIEIVSEIIQRKAQERSVILITHQKAFAPTNANTIHLQLVDGITQYDRP